jgi:hypothetical protein
VFKSFLAIFAVLSVVMLGTLSAYAQGGAQSTCDEIFAKYAGNKSSMSMSGFKQYWNASGHKQQVSTGNAPAGGAEIAFLMASSGSFQMSKSEFCHWVRHSPEAQR